MSAAPGASRAHRRTLLKAGVATAWAVPVVQAVTATPAAAVSGTPANLSTTTYAVTKSGNNYIITYTVKNTGALATTALNAVVTAQSNVASITRTSTSWSGSSPTFTALTQLAGGNSTTSFVLTVTRTSNKLPGTFTIAFSPGATGIAGVVPTTFP